MLDLVELQKHIPDIVEEERNRIDDPSEQLELAFKIYHEALRNFADFEKRVTQAKTRVKWLFAEINQPLKKQPTPEPVPKQYTLLATDGSQIFPSYHEIVPYYLINIGQVVIHYGTNHRAKLWSTPTPYFRKEDMFIEKEDGHASLSSDEISAIRDIMELEALAELIKKHRLRKSQSGVDLPVVAISDGPLIMWHLKNKSEKLRDELLMRLEKALDDIREEKVPVVGYMGSSRHSEFLKSLRIYKCPRDNIGCDDCRTKELSSDRKCHQIRSIRDCQLFAKILETGERSAVFRNSSNFIKNHYGDNNIDFFYINVGTYGGYKEIARVEFPYWVAEEPDMLNLVHTVILDQVQKGMSYPLALSEAHEQAVVRGSDRELFYQLIENALSQENIYKHPTRKALSKRRVTI